jgi:2-amino-4-hydroxy-6-hydroxymethyldihydropteridine diphosphokinase
MEQTGELDLVLIGLGANLPSAFGVPRQTLEAALRRLAEVGLVIARRSRFWRTRPVPASDQPWFVNAVVALGTAPPPHELMALLHRVEKEFGRSRTEVNAPRVLDLDLLAYGRTTLDMAGAPRLPHPRLAERAFVLLPIRDIAPNWIHPVGGMGLTAMLAALPAEQECHPVEHPYE